MGESLPNQEIFRRLSRALGYEEKELYESDQALINGMMDQMGLDFDFNEFKQKGWIALTEEPLIFFDDLKFATPSGKIEIASAQAEQLGLPRLPQPWADDPPAEGKLRLLTPSSMWRMNDSYANDPGIIKQSGPASVTLHPDDAKRLGISINDLVRLHNESGEVELLVHIDDMVPAGVALSYKGRWPKLENNNHMNALHKAVKADMGESTSVHSTEVQISLVL
jgi:anaerobic selenocysteine-containing dehydrogenase